jgi:murein DD-endopeptidase MepM/ murein hydrolase activator NlpD
VPKERLLVRIQTPGGRLRLAGLTASFAAGAALVPGAASSSTIHAAAAGDPVSILLQAPAPAGPVPGANRLLPADLLDMVVPAPKRAAHTGAPSVRFPVRGSASFGSAAARFGNNRGSHTHEGQDVFATAGTRLVAVRDSIVVATGGGDARGNYVELYSRARNRTYVYFHMLRPAAVRPGQRVRAGRTIGRVGCTGRCFGDHLHFEIHRGRGAAGPAVDPLPLLLRWRKAGATAQLRA